MWVSGPVPVTSECDQPCERFPKWEAQSGKHTHCGIRRAFDSFAFCS